MDIESVFGECADENNEYVSLWRNVVIQAIRDAVESQQEALKLKLRWADTKDCQLICWCANLPYQEVRNKIHEIASWDENREYHHQKHLSYFKSTAKKELINSRNFA